MIAPLLSENFTNDAARMSARFPKNTAVGVTVQGDLATVSIIYDAGTSRYTVTAGDRSQSFGPSDRSGSLSNGQADVYVRSTGNITDRLTLTRPGTTGRFTYRYVGAGLWQRSVEDSTGFSETSDAFSYGVETPYVTLPKSGKGNFLTDMTGVKDALLIKGEGVLAVEFNSGQIMMEGTYSYIDRDTGIAQNPMHYTGSATLVSGANNFSGTIDVGLSQNDLQGRFYGPGAEEVGASFGGAGAVGTLIGRRAAPGGTPGIDSLKGGQFFDYRTSDYVTGFPKQLDLMTAQFGLERDGSVALAGPTTALQSGPDTLYVNFEFPEYQFLRDGIFVESFKYPLGPGNDASFSYFWRQVNERTIELTVSKPGSSNPTIALSYLAYGGWITTDVYETAGITKADEVYFAYGMRTNPLIFPTSGTGTYGGILYGRGASTTGQDNFYRLAGDFAVSANFATSMLSGSFSPVLTNVANSQILTVGPLQLAGGLSPASSYAFSESFTSSVTDSSENLFQANFFGPTASEFGGVFKGNVLNPGNAAETIAITGVAAGRQ